MLEASKDTATQSEEEITELKQKARLAEKDISNKQGNIKIIQAKKKTVSVLYCGGSCYSRCRHRRWEVI